MQMPKRFVVALPGIDRIVGGVRAAEVISQEVARLNASRVFLLASRSLAHATDEVARVQAALGDRLAATFLDMPPFGPIEDVLRATAVAREACADVVVTLGGGTVTDSGRIITIALKSGLGAGADLAEVCRLYARGRPKPNEPELSPDVPLICIPTTLSGGEFSFGAGALNHDGQKIAFLHRKAAARTIIMDPWISRHTPEWLWLSTGVRGVDHATETLASLQSNAWCDSIAESALRLLASGLRRCRADPGDIAARSDCQSGVGLAMMPQLAGVPMGASHAIGHSLGGLCHVPHGYTSCVLLPAVQQWNRMGSPAAIAPGSDRISAALGDPDLPPERALGSLIADLGLPRSLADVGIEGAAPTLQRIAEHALPNVWIKTNPRHIDSAGDIIEILQIARDAEAKGRRGAAWA